MRRVTKLILASVFLMGAAAASAQQPDRERPKDEPRPGEKDRGRSDPGRGDRGELGRSDRGGRPDFRGGPPRPGQVLPPFLGEVLKLTDEQKKQVNALQKEVDAKLDSILTAEQKKRLAEIRERGPGGRGGFGGRQGEGGRPGDGGSPRPEGEGGRPLRPDAP